MRRYVFSEFYEFLKSHHKQYFKNLFYVKKYVFRIYNKDKNNGEKIFLDINS